MLDQDDLKWIATTSTELNSMLQQIARYADLARQNKGDHSYIEILGERVDLATKTAQDLFDRVTTRILEGRAKAKNPRRIHRACRSSVVRSATEPPLKLERRLRSRSARQRRQHKRRSKGASNPSGN
jgi:hypothetical protein